jgi:lipopolysaccharide/colanic/teichoic acid biosynthesis glycosyltransferase
MSAQEKYLPAEETASSVGDEAEALDVKVYLRAKRVMDILLSAAALAILSPVLLATALLIKLDSPGPIIFSHERMGYDGRRRLLKTFKMHKFRSMFNNCDQRPHEQLVRDWARGKKEPGGDPDLVKLSHDSRITRLGHVLRKTSLDELPQLWNVLLGEMSLVGPRPVPLYEVAEYSPWHHGRLYATPGITCLWQVQGRGQVGLDEMVLMDLEYIERRSLWFDFKILLRTIPVVLSRRGAA